MLLVEKLLEKEIKKLEDAGRPRKDEILYCQFNKELAVIRKIRMDIFDMVGEIEEINQRTANQAIYLMEPEKFEEMAEKARKYDAIAKIIDKGKESCSFLT